MRLNNTSLHACIYAEVIAIRFKKIINLLILIFDSIYVRVCGDFWGSYLNIFTIFCLTGDKFIAHQNSLTCEEKGVG